MLCFNHQESQAIGICRSCGRGVCLKCENLTNTPTLSCSLECAKQNIAINELNERAQKIYGISSKGHKSKIPLPALTWFLTVFVSLLVFQFISNNKLGLKLDSFYITIISFLGVGSFIWYKFRK